MQGKHDEISKLMQQKVVSSLAGSYDAFNVQKGRDKESQQKIYVNMLLTD